MDSADIMIIGGGIAGLSAAAALAAHGRVIVLEAEDSLGVHSSGRSATFLHFGIGGQTVRALTAFSRKSEFADIATPTPALFIANEGMRARLTELQGEMSNHTTTVRAVDEGEMRDLCPVLRFGGDAVVAGVVDTAGLKLDADALLQGYARTVRGGGGKVVNGERAAAISRDGAWRVTTERGNVYSAPILIDAAGAWADQVAVLAGVMPLGLTPLRRTIIVVDAEDCAGWPFVKTAVDEFYLLTSGGRVLASPVDEVPSEPGDAQPEEYDIALAAHRLEQWTTLPVRRIQHRWAGLRTFTHDRIPVAGFAPDAPGFFWLAGQGGYGLQTAPGMAAAVAAIITGGSWPAGLTANGITPADLAPERLARRQ